MSAHFKWYPASEEVVVPWNARYSFPSQANKAVKITPRIPPKNGAIFTPGQVMRLEFPAQGYVNPLNTTLEFDVTLWGYATSSAQIVRFQNNIQSIFNRVRLLYGATPLEDMINYNVIVRSLTEWTATNGQGTFDQTSIAEGIGGVTIDTDSTTPPYHGNCNVRQKYVHGISTISGSTPANFTGGASFGPVPQATDWVTTSPNGTVGVTRRYQVNFALGLFTQDKLIPVKFMASQLAVEISLEQAPACIFVAAKAGETGAPTYAVGNVNLIPEILEFDASYDSMFLQGLRDGGVPLKFASWHTYIFSSANSSNVNLLVQERSRSVKALFAVQRRAQPTFVVDSGATFFDTAIAGSSTLQNFQFRIGGRYFPAAPVQCSGNVGSPCSNGGAEAYVELQKALNIVGDYRLSTSCNASRWGVQGPTSGFLQEYDYVTSLTGYSTTGNPAIQVVESTGNAFCGSLASACFAMATDLETSNGVEISGLNAEEQSDIALIANWKSGQVTGGAAQPSSLEIYSYYDAMIVLRENNVRFSVDIYFVGFGINSVNFWNESVVGLNVFFLGTPFKIFNPVIRSVSVLVMNNFGYAFNKCLCNKSMYTNIIYFFSKKYVLYCIMGGNNYGLNDSLKYFEFQLDGLDASGAYNAGYASTDWPQFLLGGKMPLSDVAAIKIIEAQIPFSWYVFNAQNTQPNVNNTHWIVTESSGATYAPLIPVGNYNGGTAFAAVLQTALNTAAGTNKWAVSYLPNLQKLEFTRTDVFPPPGPWSFSFGAPTNSGNFNPRLYMGFPGGTTTSTGLNLTMTSPNAVLISGPNYVYVNSAQFGQLANLYLPIGAKNLGGGNAGPQMAKIPVSVTSGNVIFWQDPDPQKWFDTENLPLLNSIDFYLTLGNTTTQVPLQLNGLSFSIKLAILTNVYNHNDIGGGVQHNDRIIKRIRPF